MSFVMRGLDPRTHQKRLSRWIAGSSPAMTMDQNSIFAAVPDLMLSAIPCSIFRAIAAR
jgi:hypothetical protein